MLNKFLPMIAPAAAGNNPGPVIWDLFRQVIYLETFNGDTWYPLITAAGYPLYLERIALESWGEDQAGALWVFVCPPGYTPTPGVLPDPAGMLISRFIAGSGMQVFPIVWQAPSPATPLYIPAGHTIYACYHSFAGGPPTHVEIVYWQ